MCLTRFTRIATAGDRTQNPTFSAAKARIIAIVFLSHGWRIGLIVTSYVEPVPQRRSPSSANSGDNKGTGYDFLHSVSQVQFGANISPPQCNG